MAARTSIDIRIAGPDDAAALAVFAAETFREAFGADNSPADMAAYTTNAFCENVQRREIERADIDTVLATAADSIVGYVQSWRYPPPPCVEGKCPMEIRRLYVGAAWRGTGLAGHLMNVAVTAAREQGADVVWLGVWEHNVRAQAFYRKLGLRTVGNQTFVLGGDRQTDQILSAPLGVLSEAVSTWKDAP